MSHLSKIIPNILSEAVRCNKHRLEFQNINNSPHNLARKRFTKKRDLCFPRKLESCESIPFVFALLRVIHTPPSYQRDISVNGDKESEGTMARRTIKFNLKLEFRRKITGTGDGSVRPVINLRGLLTGNLAKVRGPHRGSPRSPPGRPVYTQTHYNGISNNLGTSLDVGCWPATRRVIVLTPVYRGYRPSLGCRV